MVMPSNQHTMKLGATIKDIQCSLKPDSKRYYKRQHRRALRRIPIGDYVPATKYHASAD